MTENVKAGVIGVGYLGRFHAQKYAKMAGVELVGVADADPQRAAQVADECGTRPFADYRELLPLVDAVSVADTATVTAVDAIVAGAAAAGAINTR